MSESTQPSGCRQRRGCIGCLGLGAGGLLLALCLLLVGPFLLRTLGIFTSAETIYAGAPDRYAGERVTEALTAAGVSGAEVLVLPIAGKEGQLAVITVDENSSIGGLSGREEAEAVILETMRGLATANAAETLGIERVTVNYEGANGESLIVMTAPDDVVADFAADRISRREFLAAVDIDFSNLLASDEVQALIQEASQQ